MKNKDLLPASTLFPIVGIGASAGGLVALEQFLSHVPPDSGMAFVIVQHLDPHREGMLVELLQRRSPIPVVEAREQVQVKPDHVYVIPPGRDLSVRQGVLHLLEPTEPRGVRLPIDFFFRSLAQERQQNSIGVILSGMGSDGTLGLRAIRHAAGACFVQTPTEAQFDSMPRSAIDAGVADVVAPADELPGKILAYVGRVQLGAQAETESEAEPKDADLLDKVIVLLRAQTGHDFSLYKKSTISRRMGQHQLVFRERDVSTADGRWFKVRTMPYRTQENRIDGLVITFADITVSKRLEEDLRATQARLTALLENAKREGVTDGLS